MPDKSELLDGTSFGSRSMAITPQVMRPISAPTFPETIMRALSTVAETSENGFRIRKICCIGAGYVGGPTSAVIANKTDVICTVVDVNQKRIDAWNSSHLPIFEPGLADFVKSARDGSPNGKGPTLFFSTDVGQAIAEADLIFVSVNTPTKVAGLGAGKASDLGFVEAATREIAEFSRSNKIVVEKSTVPCRTAESIRDILAANGRAGVRFDVLSNPEFLAEGTAVQDLLRPDRILIGSLADSHALRAAAALADVYAQWIPKDRIITMNLWSCELSKLAANAMLAQRISSINALSAICEATGAEIEEVSYAVGLDKRIGPNMLKSSVGFGGSCYKKDVLNLVYLCESLHLPEAAAYWKAIIDINEWQKERFSKRVISCLYNTLSNKKVTVFGFAYKKNTGDTRESAAISIVNSLVAERGQVAIYDPQVTEEQIWQDLYMSTDNIKEMEECVTVFQDPYEACRGSSAIIIATEWDEFKVGKVGIPHRPPPITRKSSPDVPRIKPQKENSDPKTIIIGQTRSESLEQTLANPQARPFINWARIATLMSKPMFVFDGRNIINGRCLSALGFRVERIGNGRFP